MAEDSLEKDSNSEEEMSDALFSNGPTPLVESATGLHEMYTSLQQGGFTPSEALTLVGTIIVENIRGQQ